jgi:hypothetical protein
MIQGRKSMARARTGSMSVKMPIICSPASQNSRLNARAVNNDQISAVSTVS